MMYNNQNPFDVTKAIDFSDKEIHDYWVNLFGNSVSLTSILKPSSQMPMIIKGGKGSGKTHLMRRFSYAIQKLDYKEPTLSGIKSDGYVGIYLLCSGLNASRFSGKRISSEVWLAIFSYYMELWFAQNLITVMSDATKGIQAGEEKQAIACNKIVELFDIAPKHHISSFDQLLKHLMDAQKTVDIAVNNAPMIGSVDIKIDLTRGKLIFGIPRVLSEVYSELSSVTFLYLVDEFENINEEQQIYINTLLREKQAPSTFRIGTRLYGIRTTKTLSANEENREGSEFESLHLDDSLRESDYESFAIRLIKKRLIEARYISEVQRGNFKEDLENAFETCSIEEEVVQKQIKISSLERPHMKNLSQKLTHGIKHSSVPGLSNKNQISEILDLISVPSDPILEKVNTFILYKSWAKQKNLIEVARVLFEGKKEYLSGNDTNPIFSTAFTHFKGDLIAQMIRESELTQKYVGVDTFIHMSLGLPRNLLVMLKNICKWAFFNGERPFSGSAISLRSQYQGVLDSSAWFFRDAQITSGDGLDVQKSINMLAELFKEIRFSDKPSECSPSAFSVNLTGCTHTARSAITKAENLSLLIKIKSGSKEKNSKKIGEKYQLNSMLAPRWDLPIHRRGSIELSADEINSIFDPLFFGTFDKYKKDRVERMTAPFFGRNKPIPSDAPETAQTDLLE